MYWRMKERVSVCKKVSEKERESERERERSVCLRNGEREKVFCTYKNDGMSCCTFLFCLRIFFYVPKISGTKGKQDRDEGRGGGGDGG